MIFVGITPHHHHHHHHRNLYYVEYMCLHVITYLYGNRDGNHKKKAILAVSCSDHKGSNVLLPKYNSVTYEIDTVIKRTAASNIINSAAIIVIIVTKSTNPNRERTLLYFLLKYETPLGLGVHNVYITGFHRKMTLQIDNDCIKWLPNKITAITL